MEGFLCMDHFPSIDKIHSQNPFEPTDYDEHGTDGRLRAVPERAPRTGSGGQPDGRVRRHHEDHGAGLDPVGRRKQAKVHAGRRAGPPALPEGAHGLPTDRGKQPLGKLGKAKIENQNPVEATAHSSELFSFFFWWP